MSKETSLTSRDKSRSTANSISQLGTSLRPPDYNLKESIGDRSQNEIDRRVESDGQLTDGSGEWGELSDDRGVTDYLNHYQWGRVALVAESLGYTNAARHMRHYLGNTGSTLNVSVDNILRDVPTFQSAYNSYEGEVRNKVNDRILQLNQCPSNPITFDLMGTKNSSVYLRKDESPDWFFAIGGFTHWWTAKVTLTPNEDGELDVLIEMQMHIFDRYNWDGGKSVNIGPITVNDEQLGRLHKVGLAKEYDIEGVSSPKLINYSSSYTPSNSSSFPTTPIPNTDNRDGSRSDIQRNRDRAPMPGRNRN